MSQKSLKTIWLGYNKIGDDGLLDLINDQKIKDKLPFITFELSCNSITTKSLCEAANKMSPLSILTIPSGNNIDDNDLTESILEKAANEYKKILSSFEKNKTSSLANTETLFSPDLSTKLTEASAAQQNQINKPS